MTWGGIDTEIGAGFGAVTFVMRPIYMSLGEIASIFGTFAYVACHIFF